MVLVQARHSCFLKAVRLPREVSVLLVSLPGRVIDVVARVVA
jgi:hypothetical protein